ncbi:GGDEF domain-containing protein [Streptomyces sp. URMC 123]|uniref:GGDEF domain-containing protein n=1 Tax=Streptomyces sp. URMC 123 TaxID=3423403 RepID=UPI003F1B4215
MSQILHTVAAAAPLAAGWSLHGLFLRRRLTAARTDPLSGLLRRPDFQARAGRVLRRGPAAVVLVDLDGFKQLNDTAGHAAGDAVIREVGTRLAEWSEDQGPAARLGGDEFAAAARLADVRDLPWHLNDLHAWLCEPIRIEGGPVSVGASIGAQWHHPRHGTADLSVMLRRADEAMYAVKRAGGGWSIADGREPVMATVNGRRAGRPGTTTVSGGAR